MDTLLTFYNKNEEEIVITEYKEVILIINMDNKNLTTIDDIKNQTLDILEYILDYCNDFEDIKLNRTIAIVLLNMINETEEYLIQNYTLELINEFRKSIEYIV